MNKMRLNERVSSEPRVKAKTMGPNSAYEDSSSSIDDCRSNISGLYSQKSLKSMT